MKNLLLLIVMFATATVANGASYPVTLVTAETITEYPASAVPQALTGTLTGVFDDVTGVITMDAGTMSVEYRASPFASGWLFTQNVTDMVWDLNAPSVDGFFSCTEGTFGGGVGATLCPNYKWGANFIEESTWSYGVDVGGPGIDYIRTLGGDDLPAGVIDTACCGLVGTPREMQNISLLVATLDIFDGVGAENLIIETEFWDECLAAVNCDPGKTAYQFTFDVGAPAAVPVPAAAWLFGSALGLLGWMRRRKT